MSTEGKSTNRILKIRKQTFRQKIQRDGEWMLNIEAYDQHGDELHKWKVKYSYTSTNNESFLNLSGSAMISDVMYAKCYCKVEVYSNEKDKFTSRYGHMKGPLFNEFNFPYMYYIGNEYRNTLNKEIDICITIASCEEDNPFKKPKTLLDEGILTDMIIKTKDQEFPCHKLVLASHSEYFKKMFQTEMKESQTNSVDWTGVFDAPVVEDLLHFFYTGQKPPNIDDTHFGLLEAAHLCILPDLKGMCVESIASDISVRNAADVIHSAVIYESGYLQRAVVKFVAAHHYDLGADFYDQLETDICQRLLKSVFEMFGKNILHEIN